MDGQTELTVNETEEDRIRETIYRELQSELEDHDLTGDKGLGFLKAMFIVIYGRHRTPRIGEEEADTVKRLRAIGLSYGDLAFITGRVKSTVFVCCKPPETNENADLAIQTIR